MKLLLWDLETSPHVTYTWGLFDQNIGLSQLEKPSEVLCVGTKWLDEKSAKVYSLRHHGRDGMLQAVWDRMNEADGLVSWNGAAFDTPTIQKEFLLAGMPPPSPSKEIDLMRAAKKRFRLASNKLEYAAQALGVGAKVKHPGFEMWLGVMRGDDKSWARMIRYCKGDVVLLQGIYERLLPWIPSHPSHAVMRGEDVCPSCGGDDLAAEGYAYLVTGKYQRLRCRGCGRWSRSSSREGSTEIVGMS